MKAAWAEFRHSTDPFAVWLDNATTDDPAAFVVKHELRDVHNRAAQAEGRPLMTPNGFGRAFHEHRPHIAEGQRTVNGKVEGVYLGLKLR